jgi:hypothetical protein
MLRSVDWGINTDVSEARKALIFGVKQTEDCKDCLILKMKEKISYNFHKSIWRGTSLSAPV